MPHIATLPLLLKQLRLTSFSRHWEALLEQAGERGWNSAQYLTALCEQELGERHNRRISRYARESQLPAGKTLSSFDFSQVLELKAEQIVCLREQCVTFVLNTDKLPTRLLFSRAEGTKLE